MMRECLIHVHFAYWQKEKDECWKENQGKCTAAAKYNDDRMSSQPAHAPDPVSGAGWLVASWLALNTGFLANASLTSPRFLFLLHLTSLCHQLSHFSTNAKPSMPKWIWPFEQLVLVCLSPKQRFAFQSWPCRLLFSATGTSGASHRWNLSNELYILPNVLFDPEPDEMNACQPCISKTQQKSWSWPLMIVCAGDPAAARAHRDGIRRQAALVWARLVQFLEGL